MAVVVHSCMGYVMCCCCSCLVSLSLHLSPSLNVPPFSSFSLSLTPLCSSLTPHPSPLLPHSSPLFAPPSLPHSHSTLHSLTLSLTPTLPFTHPPSPTPPHSLPHSLTLLPLTISFSSVVELRFANSSITVSESVPMVDVCVNMCGYRDEPVMGFIFPVDNDDPSITGTTPPPTPHPHGLSGSTSGSGSGMISESATIGHK